jgi:hypothetical protein
MRKGTLSACLLCAALIGAWGSSLPAATCQVPSVAYPTIQSAIDDTACTEIVLAAQAFAEAAMVARSVTLQGASSVATIVEGRVQVTGGSVSLRGMCIGVSSPTGANIYPAALSVSGGAQVTGADLVVLKAVDLTVFSDGFESGDTSAWSTSVGP